jgi:hypothetical protein
MGAQPLSRHEKRVAIGMYLAGRRLTHIARYLSRSHTVLHNLLISRGIPLNKAHDTQSPAHMPTQAEIAEECKKIRATWDEREERIRRDADVAYRLPVISTRGCGF